MENSNLSFKEKQNKFQSTKNKLNKKTIFGLVGLFILVVGGVAALMLGDISQDLRQQADGGAYTTVSESENEPGNAEFGWNYETGKASTAADWSNTDIQIAGTYVHCQEGECNRHVIDLPATKKAFQAYVESHAQEDATCTQKISGACVAWKPNPKPTALPEVIPAGSTKFNSSSECASSCDGACGGSGGKYCLPVVAADNTSQNLITRADYNECIKSGNTPAECGTILENLGEVEPTARPEKIYVGGVWYTEEEYELKKYDDKYITQADHDECIANGNTPAECGTITANIGKLEPTASPSKIYFQGEWLTPEEYAAKSTDQPISAAAEEGDSRIDGQLVKCIDGDHMGWGNSDGTSWNRQKCSGGCSGNRCAGMELDPVKSTTTATTNNNPTIDGQPVKCIDGDHMGWGGSGGSWVKEKCSGGCSNNRCVGMDLDLIESTTAITPTQEYPTKCSDDGAYMSKYVGGSWQPSGCEFGCSNDKCNETAVEPTKAPIEPGKKCNPLSFNSGSCEFGCKASISPPGFFCGYPEPTVAPSEDLYLGEIAVSFDSCSDSQKEKLTSISSSIGSLAQNNKNGKVNISCNKDKEFKIKTRKDTYCLGSAEIPEDCDGIYHIRVATVSDVNGVYDPAEDTIYLTNMEESTLVHEAMHMHLYNENKSYESDSFNRQIGCRNTSNGAIFGKENSVSDYGSNNCGEAIAEGAKHFVLSPCKLKSESPEHYDWFQNHQDSPLRGNAQCQ
jgi:hypothetical protein